MAGREDERMLEVGWAPWSARSPGGICVIALQGVINRDTRFKFDEAIERSADCRIRWMLLESPGGLLDEGLRLGKEVRMQGIRTVTRLDCASACALVFLAGAERVLVGPRARIGLHQPASVRAVGNERWCGSSIDGNGVREMRQYLRWISPETAREIMDIIMRTSCDAIDWAFGQRALDLQIATGLETGSAVRPLAIGGKQ